MPCGGKSHPQKPNMRTPQFDPVEGMLDRTPSVRRASASRFVRFKNKTTPDSSFLCPDSLSDRCRQALGEYVLPAGKSVA